MMTEKIAVVAPFPNADMSLMVLVFWGSSPSDDARPVLEQKQKILVVFGLYTPSLVPQGLRTKTI